MKCVHAVISFIATIRNKNVYNHIHVHVHSSNKCIDSVWHKRKKDLRAPLMSRTVSSHPGGGLYAFHRNRLFFRIMKNHFWASTWSVAVERRRHKWSTDENGTSQSQAMHTDAADGRWTGFYGINRQVHKKLVEAFHCSETHKNIWMINEWTRFSRSYWRN